MKPLVTATWLLAFGAVLLTAGCASTQLQPQDFEGRTIAASANYPPAPVVAHPLLAPFTRARLVGAPGRDRERLQELERKLQTAAKRVDVPAHVAATLLRTAAADLGATIVDEASTADYVLDFRVYHYGLRMRTPHSRARFFMEAEARLLERASGEAVWTKRLTDSRTFSTDRSGLRLLQLSDAAFAELLDDLAGQAAARMKAALQDDVQAAP